MNQPAPIRLFLRLMRLFFIVCFACGIAASCSRVETPEPVPAPPAFCQLENIEEGLWISDSVDFTAYKFDTIDTANSVNDPFVQYQLQISCEKDTSAELFYLVVQDNEKEIVAQSSNYAEANGKLYFMNAGRVLDDTLNAIFYIDISNYTDSAFVGEYSRINSDTTRTDVKIYFGK